MTATGRTPSSPSPTTPAAVEGNRPTPGAAPSPRSTSPRATSRRSPWRVPAESTSPSWSTASRTPTPPGSTPNRRTPPPRSRTASPSGRADRGRRTAPWPHAVFHDRGPRAVAGRVGGPHRHPVAARRAAGQRQGARRPPGGCGRGAGRSPGARRRVRATARRGGRAGTACRSAGRCSTGATVTSRRAGSDNHARTTAAHGDGAQDVRDPARAAAAPAGRGRAARSRVVATDAARPARAGEGDRPAPGVVVGVEAPRVGVHGLGGRAHAHDPLGARGQRRALGRASRATKAPWVGGWSGISWPGSRPRW